VFWYRGWAKMFESRNGLNVDLPNPCRNLKQKECGKELNYAVINQDPPTACKYTSTCETTDSSLKRYAYAEASLIKLTRVLEFDQMVVGHSIMEKAGFKISGLRTTKDDKCKVLFIDVKLANVAHANQLLSLSSGLPPQVLTWDDSSQTSTKTSVKHCGKLPTIDYCATHPCVNGGTCVNGPNAYTCTCGLGWSGNNCQTDSPSPPRPTQDAPSKSPARPTHDAPLNSPVTTHTKEHKFRERMRWPHTLEP